MSQRIATDCDHRIIDAVSYALGGNIGQDDDCQRLLTQVDPKTPGKTREDVLAEIAVAFIRWNQDLKAECNRLRATLESTSITRRGTIVS